MSTQNTPTNSEIADRGEAPPQSPPDIPRSIAALSDAALVALVNAVEATAKEVIQMKIALQQDVRMLDIRIQTFEAHQEEVNRQVRSMIVEFAARANQVMQLGSTEEV
ncbi:unnamed protein product [Peniophora sp. CBMAI 1063]|nr:unnamed protein product [Peniophora sp. CBMAI 1063]